MQSATPLRLRRIRFKDGRTIEVLRSKIEQDDGHLRSSFTRACENAKTTQNAFAGYAIVVWQTNGSSFTAARSNGQIPGILAPDYVRNALLADHTIKWAIEELEGK